MIVSTERENVKTSFFLGGKKSIVRMDPQGADTGGGP